MRPCFTLAVALAIAPPSQSFAAPPALLRVARPDGAGDCTLRFTAAGASRKRRDVAAFATGDGSGPIRMNLRGHEEELMPLMLRPPGARGPGQAWSGTYATQDAVLVVRIEAVVAPPVGGRPGLGRHRGTLTLSRGEGVLAREAVVGTAVCRGG